MGRRDVSPDASPGVLRTTTLVDKRIQYYRLYLRSCDDGIQSIDPAAGA